jgi:DNA polymerase-4
MRLQEARRLCPHAEYVEGDPAKYVGLSLQLLDLYTRCTPDVEPFSVDEAFVGLGPEAPTLEHAARVAREIQSEIDRRFGSRSVDRRRAQQAGGQDGVGGDEAARAHGARSRPASVMCSGRARSNRCGAWDRSSPSACGHSGSRPSAISARAPDHLLKAAFGVIGPQLRECAWGEDDTPLVPYHRGLDAKSMGHEVTLAGGLRRAARALEGTLLRLSDQVRAPHAGRRLRGTHRHAQAARSPLRDRPASAACSRIYTADAERIYPVARALLPC